MPKLIITLDADPKLYADGRFAEEVAILAKRAAQQYETQAFTEGALDQLFTFTKRREPKKPALRASTGKVVGGWKVEP